MLRAGRRRVKQNGQSQRDEDLERVDDGVEHQSYQQRVAKRWILEEESIVFKRQSVWALDTFFHGGHNRKEP